MQRRKFLRLTSLTAAATALAGLASIGLTELGRTSVEVKAEPRVSHWQPHDFVFNSHATPDHPFAVKFSADVNRPHGTSFTVPGFYDGDSGWKVRVSPTLLGEWLLIIRSADPGLDGNAPLSVHRKY